MLGIFSTDIENDLQAWLNSQGIKASAPPVPAKLTPQVVITRTGGYSANYIQNVNLVDFDVYDENDALAMNKACELTELVYALFEKQGLSTYVHYSDITTLPYNNPDPNNMQLSRVTFSAQIATRTGRKNDA